MRTIKTASLGSFIQLYQTAILVHQGVETTLIYLPGTYQIEKLHMPDMWISQQILTLDSTWSTLMKAISIFRIYFIWERKIFKSAGFSSKFPIYTQPERYHP